MAVWVEEQSGRWVLSVGTLRAKITPQRDIFTWWIEDDLSSSGFGVPLVRAVATLDEAKAAAEQALREMHDALAAHLAPVLRWELFRVKSLREHVATFNRYRLEAGETGWWELLFLSKSGAVIECADHGRTADGPSARRAAEAALRSLGVVFRTEGER